MNAEAIGRFAAAEERCPQERMVLIPNGVREEALAPPAEAGETRRALGLPAGAPVVGAVSRLAWKKAITHLVQATPRLLESIPDAHVVIAGDGPLRAELEAEAAALGVPERVHFLGSRDDALDLMAAFDVFVLPSVVEGMSNALSACGFHLQRFKTGTPCRLNGRTIDFSKLQVSRGDTPPRPFSFATEKITTPQTAPSSTSAGRLSVLTSTTSGMIERKKTMTLGLPRVSDSEATNARQPREADGGSTWRATGAVAIFHAR